jgi:hypothetical protein
MYQIDALLLWLYVRRLGLKIQRRYIRWQLAKMTK